MLDLQKHFTGTYAKALLADFPELSDLIRQKTIWVKDTIQTQHTENPLQRPTLTDQQIDDAHNGPFQQFFTPHIKTYMAIAKLDCALAITKEDFFKESEQSVNKIFNIPEELLENTEYATLKQLRDQLNVLIKEHNTQWESEIANWNNTLLEDFKKNGFILSDLEIRDFNINQPVSELNDRFIHLKINLPKLEKSAFDFKQYFTLKAVLAIHSALSRSQQSHAEKDIDQQLKIIQPALKNINQAEKQLAETQSNALEQLVAGIGI